MKCPFCFEESHNVSDFFLLTNGKGIHEWCIDELSNRVSYLNLDIAQAYTTTKNLEIKLERAQGKFKFYNSRFGLLLNTVGIYNLDSMKSKFESIVKERDIALATVSKLEQQHIKALSSLAEVYDFWPTYPPDWEERIRKLTDSSDGCEKCWSYTRLQVHHITPLGLGGSNSDSNLQVLCRDCHQKAHNTTFKKDYNRDSAAVSTKGIDKIKIIQEAIQSNKDIHIHYKDNKDNTTKRKIKPLEISKIHKGSDFSQSSKDSTYINAFYYLRNENRSFKLRYVTKIKII